MRRGRGRLGARLTRANSEVCREGPNDARTLRPAQCPCAGSEIRLFACSCRGRTGRRPPLPTSRSPWSAAGSPRARTRRRTRALSAWPVSCGSARAGLRDRLRGHRGPARGSSGRRPQPRAVEPRHPKVPALVLARGDPHRRSGRAAVPVAGRADRTGGAAPYGRAPRHRCHAEAAGACAAEAARPRHPAQHQPAGRGGARRWTRRCAGSRAPRRLLRGRRRRLRVDQGLERRPAQPSMWAFDDTVATMVERLAPLFELAARSPRPRSSSTSIWRSTRTST